MAKCSSLFKLFLLGISVFLWSCQETEARQTETPRQEIVQEQTSSHVMEEDKGSPVFVESAEQENVESHNVILSFHEAYGGTITADETEFRATLNDEELPPLDADNKIRLTLVPGQYLLKAIIPNYAAGQKEIHVRDGGVAEFDIKMSGEGLGEAYEYNIQIVENKSSVVKIAIVDPEGKPYAISRVVNVMLTKIEDGSFQDGYGVDHEGSKAEFVTDLFSVRGKYIISEDVANLFYTLKEKYNSGDYRLELVAENDALGIVFEGEASLNIK